MAFLSHTDLPTARQIAESHVEGKSWNTEPIVSCAIFELVRTKQPLTKLPKEVLEAAVASWWDFNDFSSGELGKEAQTQLESAVSLGQSNRGVPS